MRAPRVSTRAWTAVEAALRGTLAHRALVRYDAYNELSGQQSMSIALLDEEQSGIVLSCIHHRDQARVYGKQVRAGRGELELSPEEAEAVRLALSRGPGCRRGGCRAASRLRWHPAGRGSAISVPRGPSREEALLASAQPGAVEPQPLASIYDTVVALRDGEVEWAIAPIENSLEGSISATLDLLVGEPGGVEIVGEALLRVSHSLIAAGPRRAGADRERRQPSARAGAVHAVPARRAARARGSWRRARPPRRCAAWSPRGGASRPRSARCWRRRSTAARSSARASRTATTTKRASSGWDGRRAASGRRCGPAEGARLEDLAGLLGAGRRAARLAAALPRAVRAPRHQPDEDRVAPAAPAARQLHLLRRPRRARRGAARSRRRSPVCGSCARTCACSAPTPRPLRARRRRPERGGAHAARGVARRYTAALKMESTVPPEQVGSVSPSEHQRHGPDTSPTSAMSGRVLVLNATFEPINVCTVRRAVVLLLKEKAELLERGRSALHSESSTLARPVVIRLVSYVERAARRAPAQDHAPRGVRARQLDLPVLRLALQPDRRSRDPALQGRLLQLGEHRRLVRAVQPAQGRPAAASGGDAPAPRAAHAARGDLHPRRQPDDPGGLAGVPAARRPEGRARAARGRRAWLRRAPPWRPSLTVLTGRPRRQRGSRRDQNRRSSRGVPGWIPLGGPACPT